MAKRKPCKVIFEKTSRGVDALLRFGARTLNVANLGPHPTTAQKRRARTRLMQGCVELARDARRSR